MSTRWCFTLGCVALIACNALSGVAGLSVDDGSPVDDASTVRPDANVANPDGTIPRDARVDGAPLTGEDGAQMSNKDGAPKDSGADAVIDAPADASITGKLVFVTSVGTTAAVGSFTGADNLCATRAAAASLPGSYVAWLSAGKGSVHAMDRLGAAVGPWKLVNGQLVAADRAALLSGTLAHTIDRDELGALVASTAWTGTAPTGRYQSRSCKAWTSTAGNGRFGSTSATDGTWTSAGVDACATTRRIYCFQN
jgi:hypothetical protein